VQHNVHVSTNQLVAIKLTRMREFAALSRRGDRYLDCAPYRQLMREICMLLAYEVAGDLPIEEKIFETPYGMATGKFLRGHHYSVVVPILRTGLIMAEGFQTVFSHTHAGQIGLHRDKTSRELLQYVIVLPDADPSDRLFIVLDSVIATGETADRALSILKDHGATNISFVGLVASRPGIERLAKDHPKVRFYLAAVDDGLDDKEGWVIPGLGAVSELLFGFRSTRTA
jgi:uracil phosphoribosyltransferase